MSSRIEDNLYVDGRISARHLTVPAQTIADEAIRADARIAAEKLEHQHRAGFADESATTATAKSRIVHVVEASEGTLIAVRAGLVTPCTGDAEITVDLHKNGSTVLASTITLDSNQSGYQSVSGSLAATALTEGDVLEVVITTNAGTGTLGAGLFLSATLNEDSA